MDYEKIKKLLIEAQEMMKEIPQECKGMSEVARNNREKYMAVKSMIRDLIEYL